MKTNEDLMSELIYNAESGKHRQFQYLRNYLEYSRARQIRRAHKLLVASLRQSLNKQFKRYCKTIKAGESDVIKLLAYKTTDKVLAFYEEELNTIDNMIVEYECYLVNGNLLDFVFGYQRPTDKLWDHRSL
jgi:hypothetical protein